MNQYEVHIVEPTEIDSIGFQSRRKGLEVRDCFLILEPSNKCRLGLLVRPELDTTVVESVVRGEGGVIEIDRCRIRLTDYDLNEYIPGRVGYKDGIDHVQQSLVRSSSRTYRARLPGESTGQVFNTDGRFPTNLILKHGPDCYCEGTRKVKNQGGVPQTTEMKQNRVYGEIKERTSFVHYFGEDGKEEVPNWVCEPTCPVAAMDGQSGALTSGTGAVKRASSRDKKGNRGAAYGEESREEGTEMISYGDTGGASRFFKQVQTEDELDDYLETLVRGTQNKG